MKNQFGKKTIASVLAFAIACGAVAYADPAVGDLGRLGTDIIASAASDYRAGTTVDVRNLNSGDIVRAGAVLTLQNLSVRYEDVSYTITANYLDGTVETIDRTLLTAEGGYVSKSDFVVGEITNDITMDGDRYYHGSFTCAMTEELTPVTFLSEDGTSTTIKSYKQFGGCVPDSYKMVFLDGGTYVVTRNLKLDGFIVFSGDVNIIIMDNATFTCNGLDCSGKTLSIFGQRGGSGSLVVNGIFNGINANFFNLYRGTVAVDGPKAGLKASTANIWGGELKDVEGHTGTLSVTGGQLNLNGGALCVDKVDASTYVQVASGMTYKDEDGNYYQNTLTSQQKTQIEGKSLTQCYAYSITVDSKTEHGKISVDQALADSGSNVIVNVTPDAGYVLDKLVINNGAISALKAEDGTHYFVMPSFNVTVSAVFKKYVKPVVLTEAGDINSDGKVDFTDLVALKQYVAGVGELPASANGDVNFDGDIDKFDVEALNNYLCGFTASIE